MSLSESLTRGDVSSDSTDYQDMGGSHGPRGVNKSSSSSSFVDAVWGSNARKVVTIATALIITVLLGIVVYALTHQADVVPGPAPGDSSTGGSPYTPPPYVPAETEMLRRLAYEMDMSRDLSADPCENWYQYACGGWVANTQLAPNQTMNTKGFTEARNDNQRYIAEILNADWPIITPMFQSCMDVQAITQVGLEPVRRLMWALSPNSSVITSKSQLFYALGELRHDMRLSALVTAAQTSNQSNPRQPMLQLGFGGFTINGNNAWMSYLGVNASMILPRLVDGITAMFQLLDGDSSQQSSRYYAQQVVAFETALMNITSRAAIAQYNRRTPSLQQTIDEALAAEHALGAENGMFSFSEVAALTPNMDMGAYFNGSSLTRVLMDHNTPAMAYLPDNASFPMVDALVAATPLDVLLAYTRWRALNVSMPYLSYDVRALHHSYFGEFEPVNSYDEQALGALPNNYQYCSTLVVNNMDDLFGRYFMQLRLQPEKADMARNLITWIRQAFERNLPSISWMDEATRAVALDKANAVLELVGGPRDFNWADYSTVTMRRTGDQYYNNWLQLQSMRANDEWDQLTKNISRAKFTMNPSLVNAQYSSRANAMTFPAAILQEPFFDFDYPMAVNLGRIGMVMGHELLHGFDNNGRQFDKDGVRRQWWDDSVVAAFVEKSQCIIRQYDNITVQGTNVNGTFTLGENIADNGGLHMAYLALQWYKDTLWTNGSMVDPTPPSKHPLTTDQLFYWANAQTWCTKATDAAIANQIRTDVHSPGEARVWGPIVNQPADQFAKAFNCPVGSRMNPATKCDLY